MDRGLQCGDTLECTAADALAGNFGEEPLDEVHPGRAGRREVQLEARMPVEPSLHLGRLVRRGVVEHDVDVEVLLDTSVDPPQEREELA